VLSVLLPQEKKLLLDLSSSLLEDNGKEQLLADGKLDKMFRSSLIKLSLVNSELTNSLLTISMD
jgi:hypothetical protein